MDRRRRVGVLSAEPPPKKKHNKIDRSKRHNEEVKKLKTDLMLLLNFNVQ